MFDYSLYINFVSIDYCTCKIDHVSTFIHLRYYQVIVITVGSEAPSGTNRSPRNGNYLPKYLGQTIGVQLLSNTRYYVLRVYTVHACQDCISILNLSSSISHANMSIFTSKLLGTITTTMAHDVNIGSMHCMCMHAYITTLLHEHLHVATLYTFVESFSGVKRLCFQSKFLLSAFPSVALRHCSRIYQRRTSKPLLTSILHVYIVSTTIKSINCINNRQRSYHSS